MAQRLKDLTGQKFGRLTVIERGEDCITPPKRDCLYCAGKMVRRTDGERRWWYCFSCHFEFPDEAVIHEAG